MLLDQAIERASELAWEEDMDMQVGVDNYHGWIIRCIEEQTDDLAYVILVNSEGVMPDWQDEYERAKAAQ